MKTYPECLNEVADNWFRLNDYGENFKGWSLLPMQAKLFLHTEAADIYAKELVREQLRLKAEADKHIIKTFVKQAVELARKKTWEQGLFDLAEQDIYNELGL